MDAITLLKTDHQTVEQLFKRYEHAGERAFTEKRQIVDRIIEELSIHASIEETLFYPVTRATVAEIEDVALESLEEHHIVKWVLAELAKMDPADERFDAKVTVLIENVRHHVKEEEGDYFPKVRDELGRSALADLGDAMVAAKKVAPTHPHPLAADAPPGNLVTGAVSGVVDRVGDTVSGIAQGGVTAVQDLVARMTGSRKSQPAPTGTSAARKEATKYRKQASDATDTAVRTTKIATAGAKRTVTAAKAGATKTTRAATTGAKSTTRAAKAGAKTTATTATTAKRAARRTKAASTTATKASNGAQSTRNRSNGTKSATSTVARAAKSGAETTSSTAKRPANRTKASAAR